MTRSDRFPGNRYTALEEVQSLLRFRRFELLSFLETLAKAEDGFLQYRFGNLSVCFTVNEGLAGILGCAKSPKEDGAACGGDSGKNLICIGLEIEKDNVSTSTSYQFSLEELGGICRTKQLRIESFGESQMARYRIEGNKAVRSNPFCPRCGSGVFLADKGDWWACGKCGTRWTKDSFGKQQFQE